MPGDRPDNPAEPDENNGKPGPGAISTDFGRTAASRADSAADRGERL